jgi:hypothetical protein
MEPLVKVALVGTAKHRELPLDGEHEVDALLAKLPGEDRENQFLLRAGASSLYQQCGQAARSDVPRLEPAPVGPGTLVSRRGVDVLRQALVAEKGELLLEFLKALQDMRRDLPHELLPIALGQDKPEVREALLPVLGERGRWLSRFHPSWNWVTHGPHALSAEDRVALQRAWEEGNLTQRRVALGVMRKSDPDEARRWLEQSLPKEKADNRASFVEQLEAGLSQNDEPLLERLLDDRSDQVRIAAADLLCKLPESRFTQRMIDRGNGMLRGDPKARSFKLKGFPPAEVPKDWLRDGIFDVIQGRGKRATWMMMVLDKIRLKHWVTHFGKTPHELVAAIQGDDAAEDVLLSWTRSLCRFGGQSPEDAAWVDVLWQVGLDLVQARKKVDPVDIHRQAMMVRVIPGPVAEKKIEPFFRGELQNTQALSLMLPVLARPWSPGFAQAYLRQARLVAKSAPIDQAFEWLKKTLEPAARALPRGAFAAALAPWDVERPGEKSWTASAIVQAIDQFTDLVRVRQSFYEELQRS